MIASDGVFQPTDRIEIALANGQASAVFGFQSAMAALILENAHTAVGSVDLDRSFGESAFGAIHLRMLRANGELGSWVSLGTLVRRPHITLVQCERGDCVLHGSELFLIQELSASDDFQHPIPVPLTAVGDTFAFRIPETNVESLSCRLRDASSAMARIQLQQGRARSSGGPVDSQ